MKVLFAASEARPFVASGGLGDVAGALPKNLLACGVDCRVILPFYGSIPPKFRESCRYLTNFQVNLGWRKQYCGLFTAEYEGVTYYFLDNEFYFKRSGLYGYGDDAERFAFFSMAILEAVRHMDFQPDVLHCNDWQTALVPLFWHLHYRYVPEMERIKTLFTIHNIQYQGRYGMDVAGDLLGLPREKENLVEYDGCVNFMKAAIEFSNAISTVSPTYAGEILDPWYAHGLDRLLRDRRYKLAGILNGIDTQSYDPETDPELPAHFSADNLSGKAIDKGELQRELGLQEDDRAMLIGMVTRLASHKGLDLVKYIAGEILRLPVQLAVLGAGEYLYENFFTQLQENFPGRVRVVLGFEPALARRIYAGSDVFLMPSKSEPCGLAQMLALRYGTIPIVRETGGLKDTVRDLGGKDGNGFTFQTYNAHDMLNAVQRAQQLFVDEAAWQKAMQNAMRCDNGWERSAALYKRLYSKIMSQ